MFDSHQKLIELRKQEKELEVIWAWSGRCNITDEYKFFMSILYTCF